MAIREDRRRESPAGCSAATRATRWRGRHARRVGGIAVAGWVVFVISASSPGFTVPQRLRGSQQEGAVGATTVACCRSSPSPIISLTRTWTARSGRPSFAAISTIAVGCVELVDDLLAFELQEGRGALAWLVGLTIVSTANSWPRARVRPPVTMNARTTSSPSSTSSW